MKPFLQTVAEDVYNKYNENLSRICIVFPNQRARLYFNNYLSKLIDKPIWLPGYFTISELFKHFSNLQLADNVYLVFKLYEVFKKAKDTNELIDDFYFWGEMLLNDFDELDKYLINTEGLFKNLKNLKAVHDQFNYLSPEQIEAIQSFWQSFNPDNYSKHQQEFISIWTVLNQIYDEFRKLIGYDNMAYEGMIYKEVIEKIDKIDIDKYEKYIFIGFNALNNCEKKLFKYLSNIGRADFYWDYQSYYIKNNYHEAGYFLRENIKEFPGYFEQNNQETNQKQPKIQAISVSNDISQATVLGNLFKEYSAHPDFNWNKTAVILADEHMLIPVLHAIPDTVPGINVSMGYPLQNTPVYSLFECIIGLRKNTITSDNKQIKYDYKNIISLLNHQYIKVFDPTGINNFIAGIVKQNQTYLSKNEIIKGPIIDLLLSEYETINEFSAYLLNIIHYIATNRQEFTDIEENRRNLENEFFYYLYISIQRLNEVIQNNNTTLKIETYTQLLRKIVRKITIPFVGEPLQGLQIIGILETRAIDFENIIIISMNEGVFPKSNLAASFIPYNLRKGFGLPTPKNHDSIYAYYFYRLLKQAKNISLVYSTKSDGLVTGEMSRYIYQLKYSSEFDIKERSFDYDIKPVKIKPIAIQKNDRIISRLIELSGIEKNSYLSPSAINTYINCPLRFYFRYIEKIEEPDEVSEEVEAMDFGSILHAAIHKLYRKFIGKEIHDDDLDSILSNGDLISSAIYTAFKEVYFKSKSDIRISGRNSIIFDVIVKYVKQIITIDKQFTPFYPLYLEQYFDTIIPVQLSDGNVNVTIGGKIDRIDKFDNKIRIIDYKTGKPNLNFKDIPDIISGENENRNNAAFQTLLYSLIYSKKESYEQIIPALYFTQVLFNDDFSYRLKMKEGNKYKTIENYTDIAGEFENGLQSILVDLFDKSKKFNQVENTKLCVHCPYKQICQR